MTPKVTLALFAFNQERFVREAIDSAFAQTFSPLEIILSDDCSTDRTFAIMQEMAAAYSGPHRIRVRRGLSNVGTVQHVIDVARQAEGALFVVAAGDDISYPDRALALYAAWRETGASAIASWHDEIDVHGAVLRRDVDFPPSQATQKVFGAEPQAYRENGRIVTAPGFCAAYPRSFWAELPDPRSVLLIEDGLASALIILRGGKIARVPRSLIAYRVLDDSATVRKGRLTLADIRKREDKISRGAREWLPHIEYLLDQVAREGLTPQPRTLRQFDLVRRHGQVHMDLWQTRPLLRLMRLTKVRSWEQARFLAPRLFGLRAFATARRLLER